MSLFIRNDTLYHESICESLRSRSVLINEDDDVLRIRERDGTVSAELIALLFAVFPFPTVPICLLGSVVGVLWEFNSCYIWDIYRRRCCYCL
jgi:hypothetical protein